MEDGISICITAYKAQDFIEECLDSVMNQTWLKAHNNWEIIVGVDGCADTLNKLNAIRGKYKNLRILMMNENHGTYITTNTIMKEARYSCLLRFDSDDIMNPNMVEVLMKNQTGYDIVTFMLQNFGLSKRIYESCGVLLLKKSVFEKFGGYQPWRCSGDDEFRTRVRKFIKLRHLNDILFKRRVHSESLTQKAGSTSLVSKVKGGERERNQNYVRRMRIQKESDAIIKCVTSSFKEICVIKEETERTNLHIKNNYYWNFLGMKKINILTVHYNTPNLLNALIRSINKFTPNCNIYVFENSDEKPFENIYDNVTILDNSHGDIINFNEWLKTFNDKGTTMNNYGSAKHAYTIEKCMHLIPEGFILLDSDVVLKKDISDLWDDKYGFIGEAEKQPSNKIIRLKPYICYVNTAMCKNKNIHYFNAEHMWGLHNTDRSDWEDTGAYFYNTAKNIPHRMIHTDDYIEHYAAGSWENQFNSRKLQPDYLKRKYSLSSDEWLEINKDLWYTMTKTGTEKIIVTFTSWTKRIKNVPHTIAEMVKQTLKPDIINLNLSVAEFPKKEASLPAEVLKAIKDEPTAQINWVEGPNRKQWKKIIPTFQKYPNDLIVCVDDDKSYPEYFIEELYKCHKQHPNNPVATNFRTFVDGMLQHCGIGTMDKLSYYGDILNVLNEDIYSHESSDTFFTVMANKAGHPIIPVNEKLHLKITPYNDSFGLSYSKAKTCSRATVDSDCKFYKEEVAKYYKKQAKNKALLCCIAKAENHYLKEWITHYKDLGFDKIVIYDNNDLEGDMAESVIDIPEIKEGVKNGWIDVIKKPSKTKIQCQCYTECYKKYNANYEWLAFFDVDEYLMLEDCSDIHSFLAKDIFKKAQIIHINWKIYDDNGLVRVKDDDYSLKARFTRELALHNPSKARLNRELKSIVRGGLDNIAFESNPHTINSRLLKCVNAIGENANSTQQACSDICHKGAWINHYITKTIQEYIENKTKRGGGTTSMGRYTTNFFFVYNDRTEEKMKYLNERGKETLSKKAIPIATSSDSIHNKVRVNPSNVTVKNSVDINVKVKTINDIYRGGTKHNAIY